MSNLNEHDTWQVLDATKLQTYMRCPRKFFYTFILGWKSEIPSNHLVFGSAWHLAMEVLLEKGYTPEACLEAYNIANEYIREYFPPEWDQGNAPKIPANIFRALPQYCKEFKEDDFKTEHMEVAGSVAIAEGKLLHFKIDAICRDEKGVFALEHKTGSRFSSMWLAQWRQKMQISVYTHVLYCMYPQNEVFGVVVNGTFFANEPKRKKDGELYAGARDTEFKRFPQRRTLQAMEAWLVETEEIYDRVQHDYDRLATATADDSVLKAFPRNTESCSDYGQCPFLDYCASWNNPLQHADEPPTGMITEFWDPRKAETIRELVAL